MSRQQGKCCCNNDNNARSCCQNATQREVVHEERCEYAKENTCGGYRPYKNNAVLNPDFQVDDESWHVLSTLRQKTCQPTTNETDCTLDPFMSSEKLYPYSSILRKATHVINYAPESEFLKKMKQQCEFLRNCQPNMFSTLDELMRQYPDYECQKCEDAPVDAPRPREEGNSTIRSTGTQYQVDNQSHTRRRSTCSRGSQACEEESERRRATEKKSEHISRSRRVIRCRGRRKRKSTSSDRCESENEFEPTLKKPHENSCERCWRFASPGRSPVNKPDQRYDPNFRRGHSCMNFENGDIEILRVSPCRNITSVPSKDRVRVPLIKTPRPKSGPPRQSSQVRVRIEKPKTAPKSQGNRLNRPKSQVRIIPEPTHERSYTDTSSENSSQRVQEGTCLHSHHVCHGCGSAEESPESSPEIVHEPHCPLARRGSHFEPAASQRHSRGYSEVPPASRARAVFTPVQHLPEEPAPSAPVPQNFTKVKEIIHEPQPQELCERCSGRASVCENAESQAVQGPSHSDSSRRPSPQSYTPVIPPGNTGKISSPVGDLIGEDKSSASRRVPLEATDHTSQYLRTSRNGVPPIGRENISNTIRPPSPCSPCRSRRPCDTEQVLEVPATSPKDKHPSPSLHYISPNVIIKSPPKTASAGPRTSPAKDSRSPRTLSPKRPATGPPGKSKSKSPSPRAGRPKREGSKSPKKSPPKPKSPKSSPKKTKPEKTEKIPTPDWRPTLPGFESIDTLIRRLDLPHPIMECCCYPRGLCPEQGCSVEQDGTIYCCHCKRRESQSKPLPPTTPQIPIAVDLDETVYQEIQSKNNTPKPKTPVADDLDETVYTEIKIKAPPAQPGLNSFSTNDSLRSSSPKSPEVIQKQNTRATSPRNSGENPCKANGNNPSKNSPTRKYAVFYTTNENRRKDDIEVLVEEFAYGYPGIKDNRTKDITEKMKKILECPSDSMALRFQKGVSEMCRTPRSSRILYF